MGTLLAIAALFATLTSWLSVKALEKATIRLGLLDRPNERSSHTRTTPRGGGISFVLVLILGCWGCWTYFGDHLISPFKIFAYVGMALIISIVSLFDDFRSVNPAIRFGVHVGSAISVVLAFGAVRSIGLGFAICPGNIAILLTVVWIVGMTNAFNFMDGIDGITGLQGAVTGTAWTIVGVMIGAPSVAIVGVLLAGSCLGFLFSNWSPARIFMGDVGSAFLGFCFGVLPLLAIYEVRISERQSSRIPVFAVLTLWPFVADCSLTLGRRLVKREQVWKAHRSHLYQRLVRAGWSHAQVASYYGLWTVLCSFAGLSFLRTGSVCYVALVTTVFVITTWLLTLYYEAKIRQTASLG